MASSTGPFRLAPHAAYEQLFASLLADQTALNSSDLFFLYTDNRFGVSSPRYCDLAAAALAANFPNQYKFDLSAIPAARDTQIAAIQAIYNKAHPNAAPPVAQPPPAASAVPPVS